MEAATPAPGWYPDPHGSKSERYWDGAAWTDKIRKAPTVVPPPAGGVTGEPKSAEERKQLLAARSSAKASILGCRLSVVAALAAWPQIAPVVGVGHALADELGARCRVVVGNRGPAAAVDTD